MGWVYVLECSDATLYVGSTRNLGLRLHQHMTGEGAAYTKRRLPLRMVWCAEFEWISEAFDFEKKIQGWSRSKKLALIEGRLDEVLRLSGGGVKPSTMHVKTDHLPTITPW
jgi:putative endonuclease